MLTKEQIQLNKKEITRLLVSTKRKEIENLVDFLNTSNFFISPASTMFHGNYEGGLAAHSYEVYREFKRNLDHYYPEYPQDSAIISALTHDFCKINQYIENRLKSGNLSESKPYKIEDDFPYGHGEKSVQIISKYLELTNREAIAIRWHMGKDDPAWEDYQEKVEKLYPEVILLQNADKEVSKIKGI